MCHVSQNAAQSAIKSLDMALLMGGPILEDTIKNFITKIHSWSNNIETTPTSEELRPGKRAHESIDDDSSSKIPKIEVRLHLHSILQCTNNLIVWLNLVQKC